MRIAASKTKANLVFFMVAVLLEKRILRLHISRHRHLITRSNRTKIGVSGYMKAQNALLKENCHHEKDEIRLCFACRNSHELRRGARTKACTQIRTDDDCTGPYETEHRKNTTTATNDERSAECLRNFAFAGCGGISIT